MVPLGIASMTALALGALFAVWRMLRARITVSWRWLTAGGVLGAVAAALCWFVESWLWERTGLDPARGLDRGASAVLAMMILAVPMEEAGKLLAVWTAYQRGHLRSRADGVFAALTAAAGFAVVEGALFATSGARDVLVVRLLLGSLGHLLFAGAWGFVLSDAMGGRFLRRAWLIAVVFHGLFDHIVFGRGPGTLVVAGPLLFGMLGLAWLGLREARLESPLAQQVLNRALNEPTLLLREAVNRPDKPLSLFWIVCGSFVTTGVALVSIALSVYAGHRLGLDFAAADEGQVSGNAPLLLLGSAALAAFPLSGYLVARASGTESVIEPALGAALAITVVAILLSMATPVAIVFSLAVAPVAFGLSCLGAWFGMGR